MEDGGDSGIYLPMIYQTDEIDVGKPFEFSIGSNPATYTVCGLFNSAMMDNCSIMEIILILFLINTSMKCCTFLNIPVLTPLSLRIWIAMMSLKSLKN